VAHRLSIQPAFGTFENESAIIRYKISSFAMCNKNRKIIGVIRTNYLMYYNEDKMALGNFARTYLIVNTNTKTKYHTAESVIL
jgi:hypothetical protein